MSMALLIPTAPPETDPTESHCDSPDLQPTLLHILVSPLLLFFLFFFNINLFIIVYFWLCWVFVAASGLSLAVASGSYSLLWSTGCRCVGFSSCGMQAQ